MFLGNIRVVFSCKPMGNIFSYELVGTLVWKYSI